MNFETKILRLPNNKHLLILINQEQDQQEYFILDFVAEVISRSKHGLRRCLNENKFPSIISKDLSLKKIVQQYEQSIRPRNSIRLISKQVLCSMLTKISFSIQNEEVRNALIKYLEETNPSLSTILSSLPETPLQERKAKRRRITYEESTPEPTTSQQV